MPSPVMPIAKLLLFIPLLTIRALELKPPPPSLLLARHCTGDNESRMLCDCSRLFTSSEHQEAATVRSLFIRNCALSEVFFGHLNEDYLNHLTIDNSSNVLKSLNEVVPKFPFLNSLSVRRSDDNSWWGDIPDLSKNPMLDEVEFLHMGLVSFEPSLLPKYISSIDLSGNRFTAGLPDLSAFKKLEHVKCSNCDLNYMPDSLPQNAKTLDFSANNIQSLTELDSFSVGSLSYLNLSHNAIRLVSPGFFEGATERSERLITVDLSSNQLRHFDAEVIEVLAQRDVTGSNITVSVERNPLSCNCDFVMVVAELRRLEHRVKLVGSCLSPWPVTLDRLSRDYFSDEHCLREPRNKPPTSGSQPGGVSGVHYCIAGAMLVSLAACVCGRRCPSKRLLLSLRYQQLHQSDKENHFEIYQPHPAHSVVNCSYRDPSHHPPVYV